MTLICIENLSDQVDTTQTRALFEAFGPVASMRLTPVSTGRRCGGFGLVEMEDKAARRAIAGLDGTMFRGKILSVRAATDVAAADTSAAAPRPTQSNESPSILMRQSYELTEVEKVVSPGGAAGEDWYRYVLVRRASRIVGFHRGSQAEVTAYAEGCAEAFNERNRNRRGTYSMMAPRRRSPTTSK